MLEPKINTGGGTFIGGSINTNGGDFIGRDKISKAERGGVVISGNVSNSNIVTGDYNVTDPTVNLQAEYIQQIYETIDTRENTSPYEKDDLKPKLKEIQAEDEKGEDADKGYIAYRLENIKKMVPDILAVTLATITNLLAGFGMIAKKVVEKMKVDMG